MFGLASNRRRSESSLFDLIVHINSLALLSSQEGASSALDLKAAVWRGFESS